MQFKFQLLLYSQEKSLIYVINTETFSFFIDLSVSEIAFFAIEILGKIILAQTQIVLDLNDKYDSNTLLPLRFCWKYDNYIDERFVVAKYI